MQRIESPANPVLKETSLLLGPRGRKEQQAFWLEGWNPLEEALNAQLSFKRLFVREPFDPEQLAPLQRVLFERMKQKTDESNRYLVSDKAMARICSTQSPAPIAASIALPESYNQSWPQSETSSPLKKEGLLVLDGIQDPGNLGTLLRSAWAFGLKQILLLPDCCDPWNPKALRAASGATFHLDIKQTGMGSFPSLKQLQAMGFEVLCADAQLTDSKSCWEFPWEANEALALVLGQEGQGLRLNPQEKTSFSSIKVPMAQSVDSLNVAMTGSILLARWSHVWLTSKVGSA